MTMFDRSTDRRSRTAPATWAFFSGLGSEVARRTPMLIALWLSVAAIALLNFADVIVRWIVVAEAEFGAFGLYAVGGRLAQALVFFALFVWLAPKSQGFLLGLASLYFVTRFLEADDFILDFLKSQDTLAVGAPKSLDTWSLVLTVANVLAVVYLLLVLVIVLVGTATYRAYRARFADDFRSLRISEVFLWAVMLSQVTLWILMWFLVWLGGEAFNVIATYPVIGRLLVWVVFLVVVLWAVRSRALIITLAALNFLVTTLGIDGVLVGIFGQTDRLFGALENTSSLFALQGFVTLLGWLVTILLIWTLVLSVARVVRSRARDRIEAWVDARRVAIYGAEDHGSDQPTRVSVLAVLALIGSLVFPVLGLVLAYAARNDFVQAKPRKSGVDLAVAATILGWFGLGAQLFLAIVWVFATAVLGMGLMDFFGEFSGALFGLD
jgi:hypothetical protein